MHYLASQWAQYIIWSFGANLELTNRIFLIHALLYVAKDGSTRRQLANRLTLHTTQHTLCVVVIKDLIVKVRTSIKHLDQALPLIYIASACLLPALKGDGDTRHH